MHITVQTLHAGHRVVLRGDTKIGHVTGDYVIGFTAFEADGSRMGYFGRFPDPEEAYRAIVNLFTMHELDTWLDARALIALVSK